MIEMATRVGEDSAIRQETLVRQQCLPGFVDARRHVFASGFPRRRTARAASQKVGQGDARSAPDPPDLMIHIAEKGRPMELVPLLLCLNGTAPVELLHDSPVTQYQ